MYKIINSLSTILTAGEEMSKLCPNLKHGVRDCKGTEVKKLNNLPWLDKNDTETTE